MKILHGEKWRNMDNKQRLIAKLKKKTNKMKTQFQTGESEARHYQNLLDLIVLVDDLMKETNARNEAENG